jgi:DNA polymerase-3 subunit epsilon
MANEVILGIDFETSGLIPGRDFITEVAYVIKQVGRVKPLKIHHAYLWNQYAGSLSDEIVELTKITPDLLNEYGRDSSEVLDELASDVADYKVDYMMAHNAPFDRGMLHAWVKSLHEDPDDPRMQRLLDIRWICTKKDILWNFHSNKLFYVGAELGFINPFPHDALSDVLSMFKCVSEAIKSNVIHSFDAIIRRATTPDVILVGNPGYERKDEAKKRNFRWNPQAKRWEKSVKADEVELITSECPFDCTVVEEI